jgi:mono/diheme cytochrome c family protein
MALLLAGCGGANNTATSSEPTALPAPTATAAPPTAEPTVRPEQTATPVAPTPEPTPEPTAVPPTPEPTPEQTEAPVDDANDAETIDDAEAPSDSALESNDETADDSTETADGAAVLDGAAIFAGSCASCHGADGAGTGRGPSILGIGQFFPEDASPLINLVTNGGTNMPEFGTKLTTDEIEAVVQYVVATFQ